MSAAKNDGQQCLPMPSVSACVSEAFRDNADNVEWYVFICMEYCQVAWTWLSCTLSSSFSSVVARCTKCIRQPWSCL